TLRFLDGGKTLACWTAIKMCRWDVASGKELKQVQGPGFYAVSPDGKLAAANWSLPFRDDDYWFIVWDLISGRELCKVFTEKTPPLPLEFSPDGKELVRMRSDGSFDLWDVERMKVIHTFPSRQMLQGASFSPDGKILATIDLTHEILLWEVSTGKQLLDSKA